MDEAIAVIERVRAASGNAKRETLKAAKGSAPLKELLKAIYDPSITYGVTGIDYGARTSACGGRGSLGWADAQALLNDLAARKLTGNAARDAVADMGCALDGCDLMAFIMAIERDAKMGIGRNSVKKVWPDIFPKFDVMLAKPFEPKRFKGQHFTQVKKDGVRVIADATRGPGGGYMDGEVTFYSRTGKEFTGFNHLEDEIREWLSSFADDATGLTQFLADGVVFDGEVTSGSFNETVGSVRRKDEQSPDAEFHIFDWLPASEFYRGKSGLKLRTRRQHLDTMGGFLKGMSKLVVMPTYIANSVEEIQAMYQKARDNGHEGLMVKDPDAHYECKRSFAWLKLKAEESAEFRVIGAFPGEPGTKYADCLGGIVVARHHNGTIVPVRVGGGISDAQRKEWWEAFQRDVAADFDMETTTGELLGRLAECEFHEVTPDGSLRHPRFVKWRDTFTGSKE
jgi:DNA ligase 1